MTTRDSSSSSLWTMAYRPQGSSECIVTYVTPNDPMGDACHGDCLMIWTKPIPAFVARQEWRKRFPAHPPGTVFFNDAAKFPINTDRLARFTPSLN